jgi:diaminopimelate epimerase
MRIPFAKAHGAKNDFLLTWAYDAPQENLPAVARAICDRHTGVGGDGWMLVKASAEKPAGCDGAIRLFNADGSEAEVSGNGTRCAAAFLMDAGMVSGEHVRISTGAGVKHLRLIEREGLVYRFEMRMGEPVVADGHLRYRLNLSGSEREVAILNVGNPQCAVFVDSLELDWRTLGAEIEAHPFFPNRTNVSFVRPVDEHTVEVRFYERGVGETMSSGTGSTGAAAAAILRGAVRSPVRILTPAGPLDFRWDDDVYLAGPAEIVAGGEFYL